MTGTAASGPRGVGARGGKYRAYICKVQTAESGECRENLPLRIWNAGGWADK